MGSDTDEALITIGPLTVLIVIVACCIWCWCKCCRKCRRTPSQPGRVIETRTTQPLVPPPIPATVHQPPQQQPFLQNYPASPPPPYPGMPYPQPYSPPQQYPPPQGYPYAQPDVIQPPPQQVGVTLNIYQQAAPVPPNCPLPPLPTVGQPLNMPGPPNCPLPPLPPGAANPETFKQPGYNPNYAPSAPP